MTPNELRMGSTERTDGLGSYIAYHRTCTFRECGVELTSRNRAEHRLLCKPCDVIRRQVRYSESTRATPGSPNGPVKRLDRTRAKAYSLFESLLNNPTNEAIKKELLSVLMTLEMRDLMRHLPNVADKSSPCLETSSQ